MSDREISSNLVHSVWSSGLLPPCWTLQQLFWELLLVEVRWISQLCEGRSTRNIISTCRNLVTEDFIDETQQSQCWCFPPPSSTQMFGLCVFQLSSSSGHFNWTHSLFTIKSISHQICYWDLTTNNRSLFVFISSCCLMTLFICVCNVSVLNTDNMSPCSRYTTSMCV